MTAETERMSVNQDYESIAWKWMRYSGLLLIPLAWIHVIIQDVVVGVHQIDINYVAARWAFLGWRIYDFALLSFAFAHGVNGFRQVVNDYLRGEKNRRAVSWILFIFWLVFSIIGAIAIIGGVR